MLQVSTLADIAAVIDSEIEVCSETELPLFHAKRNAINCLASGIQPDNVQQIKFLLDVLDRLQEFVRDEPASESDREIALVCSARIITSLMEYHDKRDDLQVDAEEAP